MRSRSAGAGERAVKFVAAGLIADLGAATEPVRLTTDSSARARSAISKG